MKKNQKRLISWRATAGECAMVTQLREKLGRSSESDLLRHLVAEAHHALFFAVDMANVNSNKSFSIPPFPSAPIARPIPKDGACNED